MGFEPTTPTLARLCRPTGVRARSRVEVLGPVYWRKVGDVINPSVGIYY